MKKLLAFLMVLLMLVTCVYADDTAENAEETGRVEIEFCVGDEVLIINGQEVAVEKPYVVGEGVTLVPVRVITEAFGAEVGWIKETKTITLEYPDVSIVLQIGNPTAEINGRAETLLAAPELSAGGFTMVPLRFISENFGAEVGYDNTTKRITVVKETSEEGTTVEGAIESKYVCDSYYGWVMENPKDMVMDYRNFDGSYISFAYDENNYFYIRSQLLEEDYNFEKDFVDRKTSIGNAGYTLVKADKDAESDVKSMHFQAKDKVEFLDLYVFAGETHKYLIYGSFDVTNTEVKDECVRILSTFGIGLEAEDVYDFSNIVDGYRRFESEELKFSINVPEDYFMASSEDSQNRFDFAVSDFDASSDLIVVIYSKSDVGSAQELAKYDYDLNMATLNEEMTTFTTRVVNREYAGFECYQYEFTLDDGISKEYHYDTFFEVGEYVYNVSLTFDDSVKDYKDVASKILNSVKAEELDPDEVGILMRNLPTATGVFTVKHKNVQYDLPNNYIELSEGMHMSSYSGVAFAGTQIESDESVKFSELRPIIKTVESEAKAQGSEIVSSVKEVTIGNNKFYTFTLKLENDDGSVTYVEEYLTAKSGTAYMFAAYYQGRGYSRFAREEVEEILRTVSFN